MSFPEGFEAFAALICSGRSCELMDERIHRRERQGPLCDKGYKERLHHEVCKQFDISLCLRNGTKPDAQRRGVAFIHVSGHLVGDAICPGKLISPV